MRRNCGTIKVSCNEQPKKLDIITLTWLHALSFTMLVLRQQFPTSCTQLLEICRTIKIKTYKSSCWNFMLSNYYKCLTQQICFRRHSSRHILQISFLRNGSQRYWASYMHLTGFIWHSCQITTKVSHICTLVPEVSFHREEMRQAERERSSERKPLVAGDANLTIMLR